MEGVERPFPPGDYDALVVGSGPAGLQTSYFLSRLGVERHAVISSDEAPGGMFRRFPIFERLLSWTKPYAAYEDLREYELHDQNSLLADERELRALVREFGDDTSDFPPRGAMEAALAAFAERAPVRVRYGCTWESTRIADDGIVLGTSDGEYRCRVAVFAIGMTEPWLPSIPGIEHGTHYVDMRRELESYRGRRVCVIGKRNSGFEVGNALRSAVRELSLVSPSSVRLEFARAPVRSHYLAPYDQDARGSSAARVYDAALERVEANGDGFRVHAVGTKRSEPLTIEADDVIVATGFRTPLRDLPAHGLTTVVEGRLPALTPFWESVSLPGVFFAGSTMQAARGLQKHGVASNSGMLVGFRYNIRVLVEHLCETRFGVVRERRRLRPEDVVPLLLREATKGPDLRMQKGYLARVVSFPRDDGPFDEGVVPLEHFVDASGPDAVAITIELDADSTHQPVVYVRRAGRVGERPLEPTLTREYDGPEHKKALAELVEPLLPSG